MRFAYFTLLLCAGLAVAQIPTPRQQVLEAQHARPSDPWPRGRGHIVLAVPGSLEAQKAYYEPGGSFSPEFRSFGVSLWITGPQGSILKTSDSIPWSRSTNAWFGAPALSFLQFARKPASTWQTGLLALP
jgi:hypothetical protein